VFYICRSDHENDCIYSENVSEYFFEIGIQCRTLKLSSDSQRPELHECLNEDAIGVLGYNSQLDHSWLKSEKFIEAAARLNLPVIHWIMDHPSCRWPEFDALAASKSCFLFNSASSEQYFHRFCLPRARTGVIGGVGPNSRSRVSEMSRSSFLSRPIKCLIPMNLTRVGGTLEKSEALIGELEDGLAETVKEGIAQAEADLSEPLEAYLVDALFERRRGLLNKTFNRCFQLAEETVQGYRRRRIFGIARDYPVLIQSDGPARRLLNGGVAAFAENVGMQLTLSNMLSARAVLSVNPLNDELHDRTLNGLNAGCVNIVEDNALHRRVFEHGKNALLFRYGDDSLRECLDIVCNQPDRAYEIAQAGLALRDDPRFRFGGFQSILNLMQP